MALGGPYFNKFLLNVICTMVRYSQGRLPLSCASLTTQAARFSDRHVPPDWRPTADDQRTGTKTPARSSGAEYLAEAKLQLMLEMDKVRPHISRTRRS